MVEQDSNHLKPYRTVANRYTKRTTNYLATVIIASILLRIGPRFARKALARGWESLASTDFSTAG